MNHPVTTYSSEWTSLTRKRTLPPHTQYHLQWITTACDQHVQVGEKPQICWRVRAQLYNVLKATVNYVTHELPMFSTSKTSQHSIPRDPCKLQTMLTCSQYPPQLCTLSAKKLQQCSISRSKELVQRSNAWIDHSRCFSRKLRVSSIVVSYL